MELLRSQGTSVRRLATDFKTTQRLFLKLSATQPNPMAMLLASREAVVPNQSLTEVFGGYSYLNADTNGLTSRQRFVNHYVIKKAFGGFVEG
jgi:hypothetical protein